MTSVSIDDAVNLFENHLLIDVRSEGEFEQGHIPGAINIPLLDNGERHIIGTLYKQADRQTAIKKGLDFFGPKMRLVIERIEEEIRTFKGKKNGSLIVYCWRGGMRSNIMAWLLNLYGFDVKLIEGGYKRFRNWCIDIFCTGPECRLLGGYTGSGKTYILDKLRNKYELPVVDLEGIAKHRGSAFGGIGMEKQPTQEMFENILGLSIWGYTKEYEYIIFEDESQRIGMVSIPQPLWERMKSGKLMFIHLAFEQRLSNIIKDYGLLDRSLLSGAIIRLQKRLGGLETKQCLEFLVNRDIENCFRILLKYYDKVYLKSLENKKSVLKYIENFEMTDVSAEITELSKRMKSI